MPVALPADGDLAARMTQTAAIFGQREPAAPGTSAASWDPCSGCWPTGLLRAIHQVPEPT